LPSETYESQTFAIASRSDIEDIHFSHKEAADLVYDSTT
jgi:hypothetical protein